MSRRAWFWALGVAFASHNAEEWIAAPLLLQQLQSRAPAFVRGFYTDVQVDDLRRNLVVLSLIGLVVAAIAARSPTSRAWSYGMLGFAALIGLNGLTHVAFSLIWREYMPGTLTAVLVTVPISAALFLRSRHDGWIASNKPLNHLQ